MNAEAVKIIMSNRRKTSGGSGTGSVLRGVRGLLVRGRGREGGASGVQSKITVLALATVHIFDVES